MNVRAAASPRVVVTGLGLVTPLGCDLERVWARFLLGESAVAASHRFGGYAPPTKSVGEVPGVDVRTLALEFGPGADRADLRTIFGVAAARRALAHAGLAPGRHLRAGAIVASGPGAHRLEDMAALSDASGALDPEKLAAGVAAADAGSLWLNPPERPATEVASRFGLCGPTGAITTACAGAIQALGCATREIRSGRVDWMIAGGADSMIDPMGLVFFVLLGAAASEGGATACRPFSRRRTGIVMGEGAGLAVLESEAHARARGAKILAEVAGYGSTLDAWRVTAPHPQGRGAAGAMARALADARMSPDDVDAISAHATGTKRNDPAEAMAIREVFGARADRIAVTSGKSVIGHLLAAAGGVSFATAVLSIDRGLVPPTANLDDVDPACALDHVVGRARRMAVRGALVNALAFGGHNATIALRKPESPA